MSKLIWYDNKGLGYYPVQNAAAVYDQEYFDKYVEYSKTEMGVRLERFRTRFVRGLWAGPVLDVGIGCGAFLLLHGPGGTGFDINPAGVAWLKERRYFQDPYSSRPDAVTLWDSFEHLGDPLALLDRVRQWVFMSLPIYTDREAVLKSRHYRPDEHFWYHTSWGLLRYMAEAGFEVRDVSWSETEIGRDQIASFAFKRRDGATNPARIR